jgi:hypothetical protein
LFGRSDFDKYVPKILANLEEFHTIPEEFVDAGENIVVRVDMKELQNSPTRDLLPDSCASAQLQDNQIQIICECKIHPRFPGVCQHSKKYNLTLNEFCYVL